MPALHRSPALIGSDARLRRLRRDRPDCARLLSLYAAAGSQPGPHARRPAELAPEAVLGLGEFGRSIESWIRDIELERGPGLDHIARDWSRQRGFIVGLRRAMPVYYPARWLLAPRRRGDVIVT